MYIKSKIESLLPGAWSKVIFLGSIGLSILLYRFFPDLPAKYLPEAESEKFLIRLLISGATLLLGSVSLIFLLVVHNLKINRKLFSVQSEKESLSHRNSSLETDKRTLQSLLDESRLSLTDIQNQLITAKQEHSAEIKRIQEQHEKKINDIQKSRQSNSSSAISGLGIFSKE